MTDKMVWVDIETTGLGYDSGDVPLEVGLMITDRWAEEVIASNKWLVWDGAMWEDAIANMSDFVHDMHTKNELISDLRAFETVRPDEVDLRMREFLIANGIEERKSPMCGSSVGSLDRPFFQRFFPQTNLYLSYRNIDISSVKELCRITNPLLFEKLKELLPDKEFATHRVIEDIEATIREYHLYLAEYLIVEDDDDA